MSIPETVLFRCDADARLGFGHLRRCLALAGELTGLGHRCGFLTNAAESVSGWPAFRTGFPGACHAGEILDCAREMGAGLLVLDHYGADESCQMELNRAGMRWLQFEGQPGRPLWADWVLAASPAVKEQDYRPLLRNPATRLLLGPRYAILRPEFREHARPRQAGDVHRLALSFGGGGDRGALAFCLEALRHWRPAVELLVLTSSRNPNVEELRQLQQGLGKRMRLCLDAPDFAARLAGCDLALIAGGMTTFEAAALGVPFLVMEIADNQKRNAAAWAELGVAVNLGALGTLSAPDLREQVEALCQAPARRQAMSDRARALVDGLGARRIALEMDSVTKA